MELLVFLFFPSFLLLPVAAFAAFKLRSGWWGLIILAVAGIATWLAGELGARSATYRVPYGAVGGLWWLDVLLIAGYVIALLLYLAGWYIWAGKDDDAG